MEKEHKSKNNVKKIKKSSPKDKEKKNTNETHLMKVAEQKQDNDRKKEEKRVEVKQESKTENKKPDNNPKPKKPKTKINYNFYILIFGLLLLAFTVGGMAAKFITAETFSFLTNNPKKDTKSINNPSESTESAQINKSEKDKEPIQPILKTQPPQINAKAYGIYTLGENNTYNTLTTLNEEQKLPLASVTKVMTAILAMERYDLDKPVVVPAKCVGINGSSVGFRANDVLTMQDMLYGLLVKSGADAACSIANIDNEAEFIADMNAKAKDLGMENTNFTNVIGFDNIDAHYSTVTDIKKMVEYALQNSTFRKIVGTERITLNSLTTKTTYTIQNTNDLLFSIPGTVGIKTGYTDSAGECLTFLYQNRGKEILIVILGSMDRFGDTSALLEWAKTEVYDEIEPEAVPVEASEPQTQKDINSQNSET